MRYLLYLVTSLRPVTHWRWEREGEPNPFIGVQRRSRLDTTRSELVRLFSTQLSPKL